MSVEIDIFKQNRINELTRVFNSNVSVLNSVLANNIIYIKNTKLHPQVKQVKINNLISEYNNKIASLKVILNNNIIKSRNLRESEIIQTTIVINKNKNALLIGINYTGTTNELKGCISDVNCVKDRLTKQNFNNIKTMTDFTDLKPTKNNILNEFKNLLVNSQEGDLLFFLYSGHGSYALDKNNDETTGYDQLIVPLDFNMIVDDELKTIIQTNLKKKVTLFAMFDSCFSGSVLDLRYQYMDSLKYDNFTENGKELETIGNVFMISGCTDYQTSADAVINNQANGAMTWSLLESLKQKPVCSWRELVKNMRYILKGSKYTQIPQFSSGTLQNIDKLIFI